MKKIALTGVIGAGKSYVGKILRKSGYQVLDLDALAKDIRNNEAKDQIKALFNTDNPEEISKLVFNNPIYLNKLNAIMHPIIKRKMLEFMEVDETVFVEIPLLYELGWENYFDECWCINCDQKTMIERLVNYRHLTLDSAIKISEAQLSNDIKVKKADYIINNFISDNEESIIKQIKEGLERNA